MMKVKLMQGLTDDEMDLLIEETRRSHEVSVNLRGVAGVEDYKLRAWKRMFSDKDHKVSMHHQLSVEYSLQPAATREQLRFNDWLKKHRINSHHALYGTRATLPGVIRSKQRHTRNKTNWWHAQQRRHAQQLRL